MNKVLQQLIEEREDHTEELNMTSGHIHVTETPCHFPNCTMLYIMEGLSLYLSC